MREEINWYKKAPTWLRNMAGERKLFEKQGEVDQAWEEGWYGPPWLLDIELPLSHQKFNSKMEIKIAVDKDPRYVGLTINTKHRPDEIMAKIRIFELENGIIKLDEE